MKKPMNTPAFLTAAEVHKVIELTGEVASAMPGHFLCWARGLLECEGRRQDPGDDISPDNLMILHMAAYMSQHAPLEVGAGQHVKLVA